MKKKVLLIFGTRPEAIKMAPVFHELCKLEKIETTIAVTAQHREMLDQVLDLFKMNPNFDLNIMRSTQTLPEITSNVLLGITRILKEYRPNLVLVHGDTSTTFSATLAAFYERIPVAHVEAGLRTGDIYSPWPEEVNRKLTTIMTQIHFAPTSNSAANLLKEGVKKENIYITGNTVIDALLSVDKKLQDQEQLSHDFDAELHIDSSKNIILVTGHRRENFGKGFERICDALQEVAEIPNVQIIYSVHLNPNVQGPVEKKLSGFDNIILLNPQNYLPFVHLMRRASLILTDSGGIQEEAPSLGKPVLVMRDTTERPEAVDAGTVKLVGTDTKLIVNEVKKLLTDKNYYDSISNVYNPYGDGSASVTIKNIIENFLNKQEKNIE